MSTSARFEIVRFTDPQESVTEVLSYDDTFFNVTLGSILASLDSEESARTILGVYEGNSLV